MRIPYGTLLLGAPVLFLLGSAMNKLCMAANGGLMPVLVPGGCPGDISIDGVQLWVCMTAQTHLKLFADWIAIKGTGVASLGDLLIWGSEYAWWPAWSAWVALVIKDLNKDSNRRG